VSFDRARIQRAIAGALEATAQVLTDQALTDLVDGIEDEIDRRFTDFYPNVENVQDIAEKHLMRQGLYDTAKAYILYRADHQKRRQETQLRTAEAARRGRLTVTGRDGTAVLLNVRRLEHAVTRASRGLEDVSVDAVVQEVVKGI